MKVLIIGEFYEEAFATHISETFQSMDHSVRECSVYPSGSLLSNIFIKKIYHHLDRNIFSFFSFFRNHRFKKICSDINVFQPDFVLVTYDYLYHDQVTKIKSICNTKIAIWSPDSVATVASGKSHYLNAEYDHLFFKDPYIVKNLVDTLELNASYLPECFNPLKHFYEGEIEEEYFSDVTTAGNLHSFRISFFRNLLNENYSITLWGNDAPSWLNASDVKKFYKGRPVYNEEKAKVFLGSKIVLSNLSIAEIEGLNVRAFEVAGIGAFQLVDHRAGINDQFIVGEEIITYSSMKDLKEKIHFYLANPELRKKIAAKAKARAMKDHTYEMRLKQMLDIVFQ